MASRCARATSCSPAYPPYCPRFDVKRVLEEPVPEIKPAQLLPPQLGALVMRMLSKRPSMRPRSMRDVIDELDATLNDTLTFDFESLNQPAKAKPRHHRSHAPGRFGDRRRGGGRAGRGLWFPMAARRERHPSPPDRGMIH